MLSKKLQYILIRFKINTIYCGYSHYLNDELMILDNNYGGGDSNEKISRRG